MVSQILEALRKNLGVHLSVCAIATPGCVNLAPETHTLNVCVLSCGFSSFELLSRKMCFS